MKVLTAVLFSLLLISARAHGAKFSLAPIVLYDPTYGILGGGALFLRATEKPGFDLDTQIVASFDPVFHTITRFKKITVGPLGYGARLEAGNFFDSYYGEGDSTSKEAERRVDKQLLLLRPYVDYQWSPLVVTELFLDYRYRRDRGLRDVGTRVFPDEGTLGAGARFRLEKRTPLKPETWEYFTQLTAVTVPSFLRSDRDLPGFSQLEADLRGYFNFSVPWSLAMRMVGGYSMGGEPPYLFRYNLGGSERLRGYLENRFRGKHFALAQEELRFPIYKVLTGSVFFDAGSISDGALRAIKYTYGAGLRCGLPPDYVAKIRLDYGIGQDSSGIFINFGDTF